MAPVDTNAAQELQQSLATYEEELNDLKGTSKPEITSLSEIAAEIAADHGEHGASSVCAAIERRIRKAPAAEKLPGLYLLDSIVKTSGEPFTSCFARNIVQVFHTAYAAAVNDASTQRALDRLLDSWEFPQLVFPQRAVDDMKAITGRAPQQRKGVPAPSNTPVQQTQRQIQQQAAAADNLMPGMMPPMQMPMMSAMSVSQQQQSQQQQQQQQMMMMMMMMQQQQQQPQGMSNPQQEAPMQPSPATTTAEVTCGTNRVGSRGGKRKRKGNDQQQQPDHPTKQLAKRGKLESVYDMPPAAYGVGLSTMYEDENHSFGPADFSDPNAIQQRYALVVRTLYDTNAHRCQQTGRRFKDSNSYRKHLDTLFLRRQRRKDGKQQQSRSWFVRPEQWIVASAEGGSKTALQQPGHESADEANNDEEVEYLQALSAADDISEKADESQRHCALSGEKFEAYWDDEREEWRFKNAVRLQSDAFGLPAGSLVLASALPAQ